MAKATHLETATIRQFQAAYFGAFPAHQHWHQHVAAALARDGHLTTLTGRRRWFFGRRNDDATIREAIAYDPQGSVGDILNRGMLQVWRLDRCQLLLQIHDAVLVQYPEHREIDILPALLQAIQVPIDLRNGRTLLIPAEAKTGWNWSLASEDNPDGLRRFTGADDPRTRSAPV
jgi:DNA polymerase I-like protein with 3'-5' exonuclease and polymerase domains